MSGARAPYPCDPTLRISAADVITRKSDDPRLPSIDFYRFPGAHVVHTLPSNQLKNLNSRSNPSCANLVQLKPNNGHPGKLGEMPSARTNLLIARGCWHIGGSSHGSATCVPPDHFPPSLWYPWPNSVGARQADWRPRGGPSRRRRCRGWTFLYPF